MLRLVHSNPLKYGDKSVKPKNRSTVAEGFHFAYGAPVGAPRKARKMLTDRQIQAAMKSGREVVLNDGAGGRGTGSLRLLVRPTRSGPTATWFGFWKVDGRRSKLTLGRYPDLSLKDAREKFAAEVRGSVLQGGEGLEFRVGEAAREVFDLADVAV